MNTAHHLTRRKTLAALGGAALVSGMPAFLPRANAQGLTKVSFQTGWLAQAEHGGMYQAATTGIYKEHGLEVEIRPGGPQVNTVQLFMAGSSDFAEADGFRAFAYAKDKLPAVAVAAFFQKDPRVLMSHPGTGSDTLAGLKGKPLFVATTGRQTYWLWLKAKYGLTDDQLKPYAFSLAPWLVDKQSTVQGYLTSEPFNARKSGVEPVVHLLADQGFDNYASVAMATPKMVKEQPELVQRFVDATAKGWKSYLNGDPAPGNALIKKHNPQMGDDVIAYAIGAMRQYGIVETPEAQAAGGIGAMSAVRWQRFYDAMVAAGALAPGLDVKSAYTMQFVGGKRTA
ncbi:ABC transporter substrate-binding protein [uncultured Pseudacidovorax sp.]|uniref:ABC transporter substrate-binding protein n=1 Tax=uncultured Pseudacidovorax sp. TaxID=679313 RepID=UPI0025F72346|nr:ABC transporter substrate-binding protein [uncultured Pseudacidovorax sp.]